jgi:signal transduction histidine kinase
VRSILSQKITVRTFNQLFLGPHTLSLSDEKRALLTIYCVLLWMATSVYYVVWNLIFKTHSFLLPYYIFFGILSLCLILCRRGYFSAAKILLLSIGNGVVFVFSSLKPAIPGPFLFFIAGCLMAFALFGWHERVKAFLFVGLSFALMFVDRFSEISLVPDIVFTQAYIMKSFFNNLTITCVASVLIVYFLMNVNNQVENSLREQELKTQEKNTELLKVNQELDRFIYSASHDLRAPLKSIQGLINLSDHTTNLTEIKQYHKLMHDRLTGLENVLNNILDYSRNAKSELKIQPVTVYPVVEQALVDMQYSDEAKNIKVITNVPADLTLNTDVIRFSIIVNNLISNAIKYSDHRKETPTVSVNAQRANGHIQLSVEDNGEGIGEEQLQKIFSMFYRASSKSSGSGLGLYLVKETIDRLGGTIAVESTLGKGSVFTVQIPDVRQF